MLIAQRQQTIVRAVTRAGVMSVADLAGLLNVSDATVRRDLRGLDAAGVLTRVRGGASAATVSAGVRAREQSRHGGGSEVARAAAAIVRPHSGVGIVDGVHAAALAAALSNVDGLTVVTNSLRAASVLSRSARQTVVITGGICNQQQALVGPLVARSLTGLALDYAFVSPGGIEPQRGLTARSAVDAEAMRDVMARARQVCVLADRTALGRVCLFGVTPMSDVDLLVTDASPPKSWGRALDDVRVIRCSRRRDGFSITRRTRSTREPRGAGGHCVDE